MFFNKEYCQNLKFIRLFRKLPQQFYVTDYAQHDKSRFKRKPIILHQIQPSTKLRLGQFKTIKQLILN